MLDAVVVVGDVVVNLQRQLQPPLVVVIFVVPVVLVCRLLQLLVQRGVCLLLDKLHPSILVDRLRYNYVIVSIVDSMYKIICCGVVTLIYDYLLTCKSRYSCRRMWTMDQG